MLVLCVNKKCIHCRDEVCKIDETNCRIFMWDEIENCPGSIIEGAKNTEQQVQPNLQTNKGKKKWPI